MTKTNGMVKVMEFRNVHYADMPKVLYKLVTNGFAFDDIVKDRIDSCHYDVYAKRIDK